MDTLSATTGTIETIEARFNRFGEITLHPRNTPITGVTSVQYRTHPSHDWTTIESDYYDVFEKRIVVRGVGTFSLSPSVGTLQIDAFDYRTPHDTSRMMRVPVIVKITYNHGYATIPYDVKLATIIYAASLIKQRGSVAVEMDGTPSTLGGNPLDKSDMTTARGLLERYRRVV